RVTVVHMTDGAAGDPAGKATDIRALRRSEGIEALRRLGIADLRHWELPDGGLPEHLDTITRRLEQLFTAVQPATLYSFWFAEAHRDHRAVASATVRAAAALPRDCRCLLFGVNQVPTGGSLFDTTDVYAHKRHALEAYRSQLAYIDFAALSEHRDRAATVNLDIGGVRYAELYADLRPDQLARAHALAEPLQRLLLRDDG
ncbi:MAG TPA: PIG-L family deacetylase, partial [Planctomycetota bacterium]|nr:PIG-L family deacetylase [Planctomycetota bacterium]